MASAGSIRKLDEVVVNRIAAGEVIQRPANAIKEMVENCIDAKSSNIQISVRSGGLKMIQIQDDGCGIQVGDMPIVCERFTTSKLSKFEDLKAISTYGFRGEALASISHVAHLTIVSKTKDSKCAFKARYEDGTLANENGKATLPRPCAGNNGTQITVEDLFYNTAVRRKALKNPSEEFCKISDVISKYAVHNFSIGFTLKKLGDNMTALKTVANSTQVDNIRSIYGPAVAKELLEMSHENARLHYSVKGRLTNANYSVKRISLLLFINDRLVECTALRKAIETVYVNYLPKDRHPFVYLSIQISPSYVDVNVHPTKHEVHFLNEESIIEDIQRIIDTKLVGSNESRQFYTQTLMPQMLDPEGKRIRNPLYIRQSSLSGAIPSGSIASLAGPTTNVPTASNDGPTDKTYAKNAVRNDARDQKLQAFFTKKAPSTTYSTDLDQPRSAEEPLVSASLPISGKRKHCQLLRSAQPQDNRRISTDREILLSSVILLRKTMRDECNASAKDILNDCVFVGCVDASRTLIQHQTKLLMIDVKQLSAALFYQLSIANFGAFGYLRLVPAVSLHELAMVALGLEETAWTPSDGPQHELASFIVSLLMEKASMLLDYFSMEIDADGRLCSLPMLLGDYRPCMCALPSFVLRLATEVDWECERQCFETIGKELGTFYAMRDAWGESAEWQSCVEHVLLPTFRTRLLPGKDLCGNGAFLELASLPELYKVFERC